MGRRFVRSLTRVSGLAVAVAIVVAPASIASAREANEQTVAVPANTAGGVPAWDIVSSDFPADPDITFGRLPNGMRYALMHNSNPEGEAAIRFTVSVGAREEADAENGAAHFVEHMAFNGSTNIAEGELLPMLERLGLAFGADTNAETSLDYTTYKLQLPRTDDETVDTALMVIREMAGELTFDPAAVDRERGILVNEAQVRNDPNRRRVAHYLQAALPGSRLGERVRADVDGIRNISAAELRAFYEAYYRPERATLVIIGDFDVEALETKVRSGFSDWQGKGPARDIYVGPVEVTADMPTIATFVDPAIPEIVELQRFSQWEPSNNTVAAAREEVLRAIAAVALSNRMNALSRAADSPTLGAQAADQPLFRSARSFGLLAVAKDGQWAETLALAERELRRAHQFGFTAAEIAEAKANISTALANAVSQASGRNSAAIAESLIAASLQSTVPTAPAFDLEFYEAIEASLAPEAVSEAFRAGWQGGPTLVHLSTKQPIEGGDEQIAALLEQSKTVAVTPPIEEAALEFAYSDWGAPGVVVEDTTIADLGIRTVRFENGLQLNLKVTDFEPGKVAFSLRVGSGLSVFPTGRPGLREMLPVIASIDGLEAHDIDEMRRILAGKAVSIGLDGTSTALIANGATTADDLKLQLDLLGASLTASGWRPETQAQWAGVAPIVIQNIRANPAQMLSIALTAILAGKDARFGLADPDQLGRVSVDDLRAIVGPQLESGPFSIGLVGDLDPDSAIAAVAATLGALPPRDPRDEGDNEAQAAAFTTDRSTRVITHAGEADQGALSVSWPTTDGQDLRDDIRRDLLAAVMNLRLTETLREELGATYSPQAFSYAPRAYDGFGHISAFVTVPPKAMNETVASIQAIAADLASQPVSPDLLERARNPIRAGYERAETQNTSWLDLVAAAQSDPALLDRRRTRRAILDEITPDDLQVVAQEYLADTHPVEIRVIPATP